MTRLPFGLLILLGFGGISTTAAGTLALKPPHFVPGIEIDTPSLPSNCYYLNLWSYEFRWTADGFLVKDQPPFTPISAGDPPLIQSEVQLFTPPENISFATEDCGLTYDNPCIVPVGAVNDGFGKVPVGKMIRNTLRVDDVILCSNDDIGSSVNYMTFLDPMLNDDLDIVQYYQSSLASYAFQAKDKPICDGNQIIPYYPITGGTVSKLDQTSLCLETFCCCCCCGSCRACSNPSFRFYTVFVVDTTVGILFFGDWIGGQCKKGACGSR